MVKQLEQEGAAFDAISINVSSLEFSNSQLHQKLMEIIRANDVDPRRIRLELTESAIFKQKANVRKNMERLLEEGVCFYLDDFGTGYSNLARLISCPFHTVKFDKSLLYNALEDDDMSSLMKTMVEVFKDKGFDCLVEGVEDDDQSAYAEKQGFDYIQGYRYAKPRPIEELREYFREDRIG
jgi:EAL domain-containing protein (putative c-di-GMP-specific phosphodiesterase class I)